MELSKLTLEIFSKLEKKWLSEYENPTKKTRILSIDGGGIKGLITGQILIHLEDQIKSKTNDPDSRIADFFDIIAGTGVGGLFAAMLTADNGNGRPLFTAKDAVKFFSEKKSKMFKRGIFRKIYSGKRLEKVLKEVFSSLTLRDTCKPLLIPCYDLNSSGPLVFSHADATESRSFDFELWKVCRATSATPTLFKPFELTSVDGKTCCLTVDGGLVMNNPSAAAVTHVLNNKRDFPLVNGVNDLMVLSLGSGASFGGNKSRRSSGGIPTPAVVEIVLDGVSETVDQILGNAFCWNREDYLRVQSNGFVTESVKDAGNGVVVERKLEEEEVRRRAGLRMLEEKGVESLPFGGKRLLAETNGERMERFVQQLVASRKVLPASPSKENNA
ncbi:PATATIN-like protein 9 [Tasmannia lanceolata]|uniref:PATATIN-like protein 9 n=1 Tax=Tasmannia lanceolata TaxID=3420 RepID=UPI0040630C8E